VDDASRFFARRAQPKPEPKGARGGGSLLRPAGSLTAENRSRQTSPNRAVQKEGPNLRSQIIESKNQNINPPSTAFPLWEAKLLFYTLIRGGDGEELEEFACRNVLLLARLRRCRLPELIKRMEEW
jgi:hypothetical protein